METPTPPCIPASAPFDPEQRAWLNGWLAGLFGSGADASGSANEAAALEPLLVLYGSQSGTAESLAKEFSKAASRHGFEPRTMELNAYSHLDLTRESRLAIITSTWGEGDPPDNAVDFWNFINAEDAPRLENLNYSLLALGDSNYEEFCGAGRLFDERLSALGARRIHERVDCDVDYEEPARQWMDSVWDEFKKTVAGGNGNGASLAPGDNGVAVLDDAATEAASAYSRKNPFPATLVENRRLNSEDSEKETRHFSIALADSGLEYEVGDALGVWPENCGELVAATLKAMGAEAETSVTLDDGDNITLGEALRRRLDIAAPPRSLLTELSRRTTDTRLTEWLKTENKARLSEYLNGRDLCDLLEDFPDAHFRPQELIALLRKLTPRLYSIASSLKMHPREVHLTVSVVRYEAHGRRRKGVCSSFLADRAEGPGAVPVFVQPSHGFKPPPSDETPMIMVGPGTGVAPFRAFLEERQARSAAGANWLFFGDQREATDFLYRDELEAWRDSGLLERLDTAFSRDQAGKVYVQDRMRERAAELWRWLERGAHFYVCGDAKRMAKDVDVALHEIIAGEGGLTSEETVGYIKRLKTEKRYQRDVY